MVINEKHWVRATVDNKVSELEPAYAHRRSKRKVRSAGFRIIHSLKWPNPYLSRMLWTEKEEYFSGLIASIGMEFPRIQTITAPKFRYLVMLRRRFSRVSSLTKYGSKIQGHLHSARHAIIKACDSLTPKKICTAVAHDQLSIGTGHKPAHAALMKRAIAEKSEETLTEVLQLKADIVWGIHIWTKPARVSYMFWKQTQWCDRKACCRNRRAG